MLRSCETNGCQHCVQRSPTDGRVLSHICPVPESETGARASKGKGPGCSDLASSALAVFL